MRSSSVDIMLDQFAPPRRKRSPRFLVILLPFTLTLTVLLFMAYQLGRIALAALGRTLATLLHPRISLPYLFFWGLFSSWDEPQDRVSQAYIGVLQHERLALIWLNVHTHRLVPPDVVLIRAGRIFEQTIRSVGTDYGWTAFDMFAAVPPFIALFALCFFANFLAKSRRNGLRFIP